MTDKTTMGITAEPEEVEAVLHNLCGYHLAERDPVNRYTVLTREQVLYDALVAVIKRERGRALAELMAARRLTEVAELTGLGTRQRVQRLIQLAIAEQHVAEQAVAEVQAASREFDQRLAAVEATSRCWSASSRSRPTRSRSDAAVHARANEDFDEVMAIDNPSQYRTAHDGRDEDEGDQPGRRLSEATLNMPGSPP